MLHSQCRLVFKRWRRVGLEGRAARFAKAARFEGYCGVHRDRAAADGEEDWAVHMGEQLLHPDAAEFFDLTRNCPLRVVFLAETLTDILDEDRGGRCAQYQVRSQGDSRMSTVSSNLKPCNT